MQPLRSQKATDVSGDSATIYQFPCAKNDQSESDFMKSFILETLWADRHELDDECLAELKNAIRRESRRRESNLTENCSAIK